MSRTTDASLVSRSDLPICIRSIVNLSSLAQRFDTTDLDSSPIAGLPLCVAPAIEPVHTLPLAHPAFGGIKTVQARKDLYPNACVQWSGRWRESHGQ